jgi:tRNA(Ile2) C34 agmatinyltransferase TiaS
MIYAKLGRMETSTIEKRCPKCGSTAIEKGKNQEYYCTQCKETFYFVTPKGGSQFESKRYEL